MIETFLDDRVVVTVGDLTLEKVDAIVNAANSSLLGGGGVDGAIHGRGGPEILAECREIRKNLYPNGLPIGEAVITTAGLMPSKYVIHTVGPVFGRNRGRDTELLANCYLNSIKLAREHNLNSISFPAISTGIFAYPKENAAQVASSAIEKAIAGTVDLLVRLVFHTRDDARIFVKHAIFDG